jgi:hypothetical protein
MLKQVLQQTPSKCYRPFSVFLREFSKKTAKTYTSFTASFRPPFVLTGASKCYSKCSSKIQAKLKQRQIQSKRPASALRFRVDISGKSKSSSYVPRASRIDWTCNGH